MITAEEMILKKGANVVSVTGDTVIHDALTTMVENKVGAIMVTEGDKYVGIWTERDLMRNSVAEGFDTRSVKISSVMSTNLQFCSHDDTAYALMDKFLGLRLRHLLVEKDGSHIGLLSVGDVIKAVLHAKTVELESVKAIASWKYYEEWRRPD